MSNSWGDRVKELRDEREWSMDDLGARCLPPTTGSQISKLEKGKVEMTEIWVRRLAAALEVHPLDITNPAAKLAPREQALVEVYRALTEDNRDTVFRVADALPKSPGDGMKRDRQ